MCTNNFGEVEKNTIHGGLVTCRLMLRCWQLEKSTVQKATVETQHVADRHTVVKCKQLINRDIARQ